MKHWLQSNPAGRPASGILPGFCRYVFQGVVLESQFGQYVGDPSRNRYASKKFRATSVPSAVGTEAPAITIGLSGVYRCTS
jgi:hypothetical protein